MEQEPNNKKKYGVKLWIYVTSLLAVSAISIGGTYAVINAAEPDQTEQIETDTEQVSESSEFSKIEEVYDTLIANYYEELDGETLIEGAISGMTEAIGDPYTEYLNLEESSALDESISASFEGIGAEVTKNGDNVMIISPIAGSPAEEAGLQPNDIILQADDQELSGMTLNEAVSYIRGEKGTEVTLTIQRGENTFTVTVVRDTIPVETVVYNLDEDDPSIGYISITSFSSPTYDDLVAAIEDLRSQGAESFVFDVRQNPGGLLDSALAISNLFLEDGDTILQTQDRDEDPVEYFADDETMGSFKVTEPSVLLVNEGSASASEILAGAMKESADIPIIGTQTFGKGTVQNVSYLPDDSELKLTVAKWLTPSGEWIHEIGIEPTIPVELPEYANYLIIDSSQTYQQEDMSTEIENLENILEALGYSAGSADGYFDAETTAAVESFQEDQSLTVDGIVTGDTANALIDELRTLIAENDTQYNEAVNYLQSN